MLDAGSADIVVVCSGFLLIIECKIWDSEHTIPWDGKILNQSTAYRVQLEIPEIRRKVLERLGTKAVSLAGDSPKIFSLFVRPRGRDPAQDSRTVSLDWLEIEQDLARAMFRADLAAPVRSFLSSLRTNLLVRAGAENPPMQTIEYLRHYIDMEPLREIDPLHAYTRLRELTSGGEK